MNRFDLLTIGYTSYNGFYFTILDLDINKPNIDSSLFGVAVSKDYMQVHFLYFIIDIF